MCEFSHEWFANCPYDTQFTTNIPVYVYLTFNKPKYKDEACATHFDALQFGVGITGK